MGSDTMSAGSRAPLWSIPFALVTLATAVVFFGLYFLVLAVPGYTAALGAGPTWVGLMVSLPSITAAAARLATSGMARRHGQKGYLMTGLVIFAGAAGGHAFTSGLSGLLAARALLGVGWGWASTALGTLVTELTPASRRGEAIGIWGMAPTIAMAIGPAMGAVILGAGGHEVVFVTSGLLALCAAVLVAPVREPRPGPWPGDPGAGVAGGRAGGVAEGGAGAPPGTGPGVPDIMSSGGPAAAGRFGSIPRGALLPAGVSFLSSLSYGAVIAFIPLQFAREPGRTGAWFTVYALSILLSRPLMGWLSDRTGRRAIIHPSLVVGAAGMALLALGDGPALWASALLYGAGIGGGAFPTLMALTVDRCPPRQRGAAMAVFFTAYDLSIAAGAALMGPIFDWQGLPAVGLTAAAFILMADGVLWSRRVPIPQEAAR